MSEATKNEAVPADAGVGGGNPSPDGTGGDDPPPPALVRVFTSSVSFSMDIKSKQLRVLQILEARKIPHLNMDMATNEDAKREYKRLIRNKGVQPPQIFYKDWHLGDYEAFYWAVEDERLEEFLRLKPPKKPGAAPADASPAVAGIGFVVAAAAATAPKTPDALTTPGADAATAPSAPPAAPPVAPPLPATAKVPPPPPPPPSAVHPANDVGGADGDDEEDIGELDWTRLATSEMDDADLLELLSDDEDTVQVQTAAATCQSKPSVAAHAEKNDADEEEDEEEEELDLEEAAGEIDWSALDPEERAMMEELLAQEDFVEEDVEKTAAVKSTSKPGPTKGGTVAKPAGDKSSPAASKAVGKVGAAKPKDEPVKKETAEESEEAAAARHTARMMRLTGGKDFSQPVVAGLAASGIIDPLRLIPTKNNIPDEAKDIKNGGLKSPAASKTPIVKKTDSVSAAKKELPAVKQEPAAKKELPAVKKEPAAKRELPAVKKEPAANKEPPTAIPKKIPASAVLATNDAASTSNSTTTRTGLDVKKLLDLSPAERRALLRENAAKAVAPTAAKPEAAKAESDKSAADDVAKKVGAATPMDKVTGGKLAAATRTSDVSSASKIAPAAKKETQLGKTPVENTKAAVPAKTSDVNSASKNTPAARKETLLGKTSEQNTKSGGKVEDSKACGKVEDSNTGGGKVVQDGASNSVGIAPVAEEKDTKKPPAEKMVPRKFPTVRIPGQPDAPPPAVTKPPPPAPPPPPVFIQEPLSFKKKPGKSLPPPPKTPVDELKMMLSSKKPIALKKAPKLVPGLAATKLPTSSRQAMDLRHQLAPMNRSKAGLATETKEVGLKPTGDASTDAKSEENEI